MAVDNNTIIGDFLLRNTNDAQQLGLDSTMAGLSAQFGAAIFDPTRGDVYNRFVDWLVKVPAFAYTRAASFENGLKAFVKKVTYGNTVIENQIGWVLEHNYDVTDSKLLKTYFPEGAQAYHNQNRQGKYPITIARDALRNAFQTEDGLNTFAAQISQSAINSDELGTYQYMKQLLAEYDAATPMYTVHYDAVPNTVDGARMLLSDMVAWTQKIKYPSVRWNASAASGHPIATFENPERLVLLVTPEIYGYLRVLGFGMLFNRSEAETPYRIVVMDEFPMPGVFAVLCSEDWFQVYDTEYGMYGFNDVDTLAMQYRLHHWQILSASPFAPIVAFGTRDVTAGQIVTQTVTGLTVSSDTGEVAPGGTLQLTVGLTGTITPATEGVEVKPDACTWTVSAATSGGEPIALSSRTRVDADNVLHVQKTGLEASNVLKIDAVAAYVNPSGATETYTATTTVTVV